MCAITQPDISGTNSITKIATSVALSTTTMTRKDIQMQCWMEYQSDGMNDNLI